MTEGHASDMRGVLAWPERHRTLMRAVFWAYAIALFIGTHWPALKVDVPGVERPDLIIHFTIFGGWFTLFWLTGYAGGIARARTVLVSMFVAIGYAAIDERLQAIPWVRRTCAWDDLQANWIGIGIAGALALGLALWTSSRRRGSD